MHLHALASSLILSQVDIQQIVIPTNDQFVLIQLDTSQVAGLPLNLHAYLVPGSLQTLPDLGLPLGTTSTDMIWFYTHTCSLNRIIDVFRIGAHQQLWFRMAALRATFSSVRDRVEAVGASKWSERAKKIHMTPGKCKSLQ